MLNPFHLFTPLLTREWRETYAGSLLGGAWNLLQPLMLVLLYWWVFSAVWQMRLPALASGVEVPFIAFLLSAMLPWLAFQESLVRGASSVVAKADVLRHSPFPALLYPLSRVFIAHTTLGLVLLIAWFAMALSISLTASLWMLIPALLWLLMQMAFALGLALILAAFSVYLRDLLHVVPMLMTLLLFTAPILYPLELVPEGWRTLLWLNPFTPFAEGFHALLLHGVLPSSLSLILAPIYALLALGLGLRLFKRLQSGFVDVL